ncbi:Mitochondrial dimethyladenosine transferase 1 [Thelohanellus kitauei]|uniref:rRNA adenine N(6)-methyltransferase n=1 Tax=Thelohanellus kitauei TaxID=669202 RepID=A0A0C2N651_THEKT|nr:Mitochondrial dimethyladenosine transferase 1 [Thelohanellus kitauei]
MRLPVSYQEIAKVLKINPLKRYGQNFLLDENITSLMAQNAGVKDCHVVEVGPGPGSFTRSIILESCREIDCVEIDRRFGPLLDSLAQGTKTPMRIHYMDVFKFDFNHAFHAVQPVDWTEESILPKARMVGNLPFNISIGILLQWLKAVSEKRGPFRIGRIPMYLTFQKEVADNLACKNITDTSRLTIMAQAYCKVKKIQFIHKSNFVPIPKVDDLVSYKVDCVLVEIIPRAIPVIDVPFEILEQVVKGTFQYRNKILSNSLKHFTRSDDELVQKILAYSNIDPALHTHMLSLGDWNRLCRSYVRVMNEEELPLIVQPVKSPPPIVDDPENY